MTLLQAGILLWCITHLFPAVAPATRATIVEKLGEKPYKGIFSLVILAALLMIVFGWKKAVPVAVYEPPLGPGILPSVLVLLALICFFAARMQGHIKRVLRHPQMTAVILWSTSHLLTNGDDRAILLFGGLGAWAVLEIVLINRREGPRAGQIPASTKYDVMAAIIGSIVFAGLLYLHLQLFGVAPLPTLKYG